MQFLDCEKASLSTYGDKAYTDYQFEEELSDIAGIHFLPAKKS